MANNKLATKDCPGKPLFVFAHRGEAQAFLRRREWTPVRLAFEGLYRGPDGYLLISGEGRQAATERLAAVCGHLGDRLTIVINPGVAGALDSNLQTGGVYVVRTAYGIRGKEPLYQSFTSGDTAATIDCISSDRRVPDREYAEFLSNFASLVDRELWAYASVCSLFRKPFQAFKLVSDFADDHSICWDVKSMAPIYSEKLFDRVSRCTFMPVSPLRGPSLPLPETFYVTTAQRRRLVSLLNSLAIRQSASWEKILGKDLLAEIVDTVDHPKQRTAALIDRLTDMLNPFQALVRERLDELCLPLAAAGCRITYPRDLEAAQIDISTSLRDRASLERLRAALADFSIEELQDLLNGKIQLPADKEML